MGPPERFTRYGTTGCHASPIVQLSPEVWKRTRAWAAPVQGTSVRHLAQHENNRCNSVDPASHAPTYSRPSRLQKKRRTHSGCHAIRLLGPSVPGQRRQKVQPSGAGVLRKAENRGGPSALSNKVRPRCQCNLTRQPGTSSARKRNVRPRPRNGRQPSIQRRPPSTTSGTAATPLSPKESRGFRFHRTRRDLCFR